MEKKVELNEKDMEQVVGGLSGSGMDIEQMERIDVGGICGKNDNSQIRGSNCGDEGGTYVGGICG